MKNLLKLCLLMVMCLSLLLVAGCAKKDVEGTTGEQTTTGGQTESTGTLVDLPIDENPEGDPTDAVADGTGDSSNKEDNVNNDIIGDGENTENTEATGNGTDVEIAEGTESGENDFEVDFGELT